MSLLAAVTTVVALDIFILALLAYVMRSPFRLARHVAPHAQPARAVSGRVPARPAHERPRGFARTASADAAG
ncbi:MAG TPA: hypothetical protein VHT27_14665 [Solirubrobacteraceae bacterium]|jgi:hypothetical protein|nr:hypothetical protein [Solirubrobacteraceae bacterium]